MRKYTLKQRKICKIISMLLFIVIALNCTCDVWAALKVGGSSQNKYQTEGNCGLADRASCEQLVNKFLDFIEIYADADVLFNYKNHSAWEQDMKPGEWKNDSIDDVNFMIFSGHGRKKGVDGFSYNSLHYYTLNSFTNFHAGTSQGELSGAANVTTYEAKWGKKGTATRWVAAYTCNFLNTDDPYYSNMMQGINIMLGFGSKMYVDSNEGMGFAMDLGLGSNIIDAFLADASIHQKGKLSNKIIATALYASEARNDTIYNYAYSSSKPNPIGGSTKYYSISRTIP